MKAWFVSFAALLLSISVVQAIDWPAHYVVEEDTISPDGRYGILVSGLDDPMPADDRAAEEIFEKNYLADLKAHRVIAAVDKARYSKGLNRAYLSSVWTQDSRKCVAVYDQRFGFHSVMLLEMTETGLKQTDLGATIKEVIGEAAPVAGYVQLRIEGSKLLVGSDATNNPRGFEKVNTHLAFFRGIYDMGESKWLLKESQTVSEAQDELLQNLMGTTGASEVKGDARLNAVYTALYVFLPKARSEALKQEQRRWLAEVKGKPDETRLKERVKVLEKLFWTP